MKLIKIFLVTWSIVFAVSVLPAEIFIESQVLDWKDIQIKANERSKTSEFLNGPTDGFQALKLSLVDIPIGEELFLGGNEANMELLVIVKSGDTTQMIADQSKKMGPGSVSLIMPQDKIRVFNIGKTLTTIYVLYWKVRKKSSIEAIKSRTNVSSHLINWDEIEFIETEKGGRRNLIREPTSMLKEFEMHVTTLNQGKRSHLPHTHVEEEIILVRFGEVEEHIDGQLHDAGAGSVIFLRSMIPHGIRNIGAGKAEYYAFKWTLN
ncbi:MAG: cupin domain-containing protein [Halieaceae bacterium]|nr:cupin domain-containing protein [Halieaceae bacterium]